MHRKIGLEHLAVLNHAAAVHHPMSTTRPRDLRLPAPSFRPRPSHEPLTSSPLPATSACRPGPTVCMSSRVEEACRTAWCTRRLHRPQSRCTCQPRRARFYACSHSCWAHGRRISKKQNESAALVGTSLTGDVQDPHDEAHLRCTCEGTRSTHTVI